MSAVTHVTEWGLHMLASWPAARSLSVLWNHEVATFDALGLTAGAAACDGHQVREGFDAVGYHLMRDVIPTCPRCAVLRDEALEGRLPVREAKP